MTRYLFDRLNQCRFANTDFQVISAGLTRDLDDDEDRFGARTLWVRIGNQKPIFAVRDKDLKYGEFKVRRIKGDYDTNPNPTICYGLPAFTLSPSVVALTFIHDSRPGGVDLGAIFLDVKTGKIIQSINSMGSIDENSIGLMGMDRAKLAYDIQSSKPAFWFRTRQSRSGVNRGEVDLNGEKLKYWDEDLGIIKKVSLEKGIPQIEIDPEATVKNSRWKYYFNSTDELKAAAIWDDGKKAFSHETVWVASHQELDLGIGQCIQFADKKEDLKDNGWKCKKP